MKNVCELRPQVADFGMTREVSTSTNKNAVPSPEASPTEMASTSMMTSVVGTGMPTLSC